MKKVKTFFVCVFLLALSALMFARCGRSTVENNKIIIWNAETGQEALFLEGHTGTVMAVTYSPDSRQIMSCSSDGTIKIWDSMNGKLLRTISVPKRGNILAAYSPNGEKIVSAAGNVLTVWNAQSGQKLTDLTGHRGTIQSMAFTPDGILISADNNTMDSTRIRIWDINTGWEKGNLSKVDSYESIAISSDGLMLATGGYHGIKIWGWNKKHSSRVHMLGIE